MQINVTYGAGAATAPTGFKAAVQAACDYWSSTLTNNVTVNLKFDWGDTGGGMAATSLGYLTKSYASVWSSAKINATTPDQATAVAALPTFTPFSSLYVALPTAQARMLGLYSGTGSDATITLGSSLAWSFDAKNRAVAGAYDAIGTLEHEISEALGRVAGNDTSLGLGGTPTLFDFYRRNSSGAIVTSSAYQDAFFCLNGSTLLTPMGEPGGDWGDWADTILHDSFGYGATNSADMVTAVDLQSMSACGWAVAANATQLITNGGDLFHGTAASMIVDGGLSNVGIAGSNNSISVAANSAVTVVGSGNAVAFTSGDTITVAGNGAWGASNVTRGSGGVVSVGASAHADIFGSSNTITLGAGSNIGVTGAGNKIWGVGGDGVWVGGNGLNGAVDTVTTNNSFISVSAASNVAVTGWALTINVGAGSALDVTGAQNVISASSSDTLSVGGNGWNGVADMVTGDGVGLTIKALSHVDYLGSAANITAGANSVFSVTGAANAIHAGIGDTISVGGNGAWGWTNTLYGDHVSVYLNPGAHMDVFGSNNSVGAGAGSNVGVTGVGNVVTAASGDGVWVSGSGAGKNTVVGAGLNVFLSASSWSDVIGASDQIWLGDGGALGFYGSNNVVRAGSNAAVRVSGGVGNLVATQANDRVYDGGVGTTIMVGSNAGALKIDNFFADASGVIDLMGGVGGYGTAAQALAAIQSDGAGGAMLSLGAAGSIDFVGMAPSQLTAANFKIG